MDFKFDKSLKEIQKAATEFAKGEFDKELCLELETKREFPQKIYEKACELGFVGMHFPEKYSGQDLGLLENAIVIEEFCRKDSTIGGALALSSYASECILSYASDEMKEKYLPLVAEGKMLSACAFNEPGVSSDISKLKTTAVKDGEDWVINGDKTYVVNGGTAGVYIVICQTTPDAKPTKGISMFIVEADRDGIQSEKIEQKLGLRCTTSADVKFENVRVPAGNLIGKEGSGYDQAQSYMDVSRIVIASMALGIAQGALERAIDYTKEREQFKRKIAQFEITQHKLAEMATGIHLSRLITYEAAWNYDQGKIDSKLTSMAKLMASKTAVEVTNETIQLFGGYGYITEYEVESYYRDAKITEIFEGNHGVQKAVIAKSVIGRIKK